MTRPFPSNKGLLLRVKPAEATYKVVRYPHTSKPHAKVVVNVSKTFGSWFSRTPRIDSGERSENDVILLKSIVSCERRRTEFR